MDYLGTERGFLNYLFMFFPLYVVLFSIVINIFTRKTFIVPIIVFLVFGTFFAYVYSQFNAAIGNFIIPLVGYIITAFIVGWVVHKIKMRFRER
jgi:hypothetical protein